MLSTFPTLLPFLLFAFVASITPGPTNILVLSNSARYGFKAALPFIFGACISAAMIVWLVGSGFGKVLNTYPGTGTATQVIGNVWLTYLSWQIFLRAARLNGSDQKTVRAATTTWLGGCCSPSIDQSQDLDDGARSGQCICARRQ